MAGLAFRGIRKRFGPVEALRDLDVEVAEGELLVLVGPSGCGKTTAIRIAAGLERPDAGSVLIGGRDVTRLPPGKRNVSMVFQSYALFPHLTAEENIAFGLAARGVRGADRADRAHAAARLAGCAELLGRKPAELSGGERQRVALARALVREPDVFLLDEPLSSLDAQLRVETRAEIKALHQRLGNTMLYVTHDQVEALTMGDRVAVLRDGAIEQVGSPDDVYRRPQTRFVARFLGSPPMNMIAAEASGGALAAPPFRFERDDLPMDGRRVEVGVRPDVMRVDPAGHPLEVRVVEAAGEATFLHLWTGRDTVVARVDAAFRPGIGETVPVSIDPADVHVFDAETGAALANAR